MSYSHLVVEADGASRGNPGPAAGGAVVLDPGSGETLVTVGKLCGVASNNVAEYRGMIEGIRAAWGISPGAKLTVFMDSKLVVEQMSRRWKIKHPGMQTLAQEARELIAGGTVTFEWVPREKNARADAAGNKALDGGVSFLEP